MKNKPGRSVHGIPIFAVFISLAFFSVAFAAPKTVESGSPWTVTEKTTLGGLTIETGATLNAPGGYLLTMTVDGAETPIQAGEYKGQIVLTPTRKIQKALYNGKMTKGENVDYRAGLFVDAGKIVGESSVFSALVGGSYDDKAASGMKITSKGAPFNGVIINDSDYRVSDVTMAAFGEGGDDFTGYGAGIAVTGTSKAVIDNFNFSGGGPSRHGIYVGGEFEKDNLTVTVKNSFIKSDGSAGGFESGSGSATGLLVLEGILIGNVRTAMIAGYADVTYRNSTILSDGWGVLSTDDVSAPATYGDYAVNLRVEDSIVDITGGEGYGGYGTYSIGACHNVFSNTVMGNSEFSNNKYAMTWAMVAANEYAGGEFINGTTVTARYGVMWHQTQTGVVTVDSSTFNTYGANFLINHCYPVIHVSRSELNSETGVIIQLMNSEDPGMGAAYYAEVLDLNDADKDKAHDIYHVNRTDTTIFNTHLKDVVYDAQADFSDMDIHGDFYNSVAGVDDDPLHLLGQNLVLSFDKVNLKGIVSSSKCIRNKYSFYFSSEKDEDGNKIAVNADGCRIDGKWEAKQSMFGGGMPPGGEMPEGMGGEGGGPGAAPGGGGMPPQGGMPDGAGGEGGFPPGGGMPGGMGGEASKVFTPATDANGNYVVIGRRKHDLYEGVIVSGDASYLGYYTNTPVPAVNNGVIVTLKNGSVWTVTGTSYLTSLTIDNARIVAPGGYKVEMTLDGTKKEIESGKTYTGDIVLTLRKIAE